MIQDERIRDLNSAPEGEGKYVLYWMQQAQRDGYNHALEYAVESANRLNVPVVVFFGITGGFPEANLRHYYFMLQGLADTALRLRDRGILMAVRKVHPPAGAAELARDASMAVTDRGYLRVQRDWRSEGGNMFPCRLVQVESDTVVPVETAYHKEAYSAGILRPRIHAHLDRFMAPLKKRKADRSSLGMKIRGEDISDIEKTLRDLDVDRAVPPVKWLTGGEGAAERLLHEFITDKLERLESERNDPGTECLSHMGPYLHFGQISPLRVALEVLDSGSPGTDLFLEELIVRRELAMNFVFYNDSYDGYASLPGWALETLGAHRKDRREYLYSGDELEGAGTHDPYWNAAQRELVMRGKMHGYMRMYWGKKILEWSRTPDEAFALALDLNNRYSLDGRDPNGFAGVAWCFGKHDRAWPERQVYGKVRYMNDRGLERKFNMAGYLERVGGYPGDMP